MKVKKLVVLLGMSLILVTACVSPDESKPARTEEPEVARVAEAEGLVFASNRGGETADFDLYVLGEEGRTERLTAHDGLELDPCARGELVVYTHRRPTTGPAVSRLREVESAIRILDRSTGRDVVLLERRGLIVAPRLDRMNRRVCFYVLYDAPNSTAGMRSEMEVVPLAAPERARRLGPGAWPDFHPDDKRLIFTAQDGSADGALTWMDIETGTTSPFSTPGPRAARFSPDGRWLSCILPQGIDKRTAVAVVDARRTELRELSFGTPSHAANLEAGWLDAHHVVYTRVSAPPGRVSAMRASIRIAAIDAPTGDASRSLVDGESVDVLGGGALIATYGTF